MRPNIAGGMQDPRLNRGGPGNPGTVHNQPYPGYSDRVNYYWRNGGPQSPTAGSGQRSNLGRYTPPTMRDGNNWNDRGGYAYNLPNSFGPRPDFGEFNSPVAPWMRGRRGERMRAPGEGGMGGPNRSEFENTLGRPLTDQEWAEYNTPRNMLWGGGRNGGGRPNFRDMLARLIEMGGIRDTITPENNKPALPPGAEDNTTKQPFPDGYKGPDAVDPDPRPDPLIDPEGFNYWTHRQMIRQQYPSYWPGG